MTVASVEAPVRAVGVDELRQAWRAVAHGAFLPSEGGPSPLRRNGIAELWTRAEGERSVAIVGCVGSAGATTVALSAALSTDGPVRVVECCSATASGLATASSAELGRDARGWNRGRREHVLLERSSTVLADINHVPVPATADRDTLTLLDVGWDIAQLRAGANWLSASVADAEVLVVVSTATVPGMRRLATALDLLADLRRSAPADRTVIAVRGPRRRKWGRGVEHAGGPHLQCVLATGALVEIPECRALAVAGLDSRPVPPALIAASGRLLDGIARHSNR
jgi:hypothetical protein